MGQIKVDFKVIHAFGNGNDGAELLDALHLDRRGKLYGSTVFGGAGYGTVFELVQQPSGRWREKILHKFQQGDSGGNYPMGGVILDDVSNLYGTTSLGAAHNHGTAFELTKGADGWTLSVLYDFCAQPGCSDGGSPEASLVLDKAGNLYGTAGWVFELSPGQSGWTESVLYTFCAKQNCADGNGPSGLILDDKGSLYGATGDGGDYQHGGTVYKLHPLPDGTWKERVLHSFGGPGDGITPGLGALTMDGDGNLYGVTITGWDSDGIVYRLSRKPNGHWKETILHKFTGGADGDRPVGGVVLDSAGNLYGTTQSGGGACDCGTIYKLSPNPDGSWTNTVLHSFTGYDGASPSANMVFDEKGNLYGTTMFGGSGGGGVVFKFKP
jgi:uncharacterized repeat protein (TIGR03803 family)